MPESAVVISNLIGMLVVMAVWAFYGGVFRKRKLKKTPPVVEPDIIQFDDLPSGVAVMMAWSEPGIEPEYHEFIKSQVRNSMPVLGRALDRMVEENS